MLAKVSKKVLMKVTKILSKKIICGSVGKIFLMKYRYLAIFSKGIVNNPVGKGRFFKFVYSLKFHILRVKNEFQAYSIIFPNK